MESDGIQNTSEDTRKRMRYIVQCCWHHSTSNTKMFCDAILTSKQLWLHIVPMKNQLEKAEEHWM